MKNDKNHLDIDLEFLDKKETTKPNWTTSEPISNSYTTSTGNTPNQTPSSYKYNWKNILIVGGIVLFFIWAIFSGSDSTSSNGEILTGENYRCSQYYHDKAGELEPNQALGNSIDAKTTQLEAEGDRLNSEELALKNEYVDEYDQWSIDQYNQKVNDYNLRLKSYQSRVQIHKNEIESYNSTVQIYNSYLIANCTFSN